MPIMFLEPFTPKNQRAFGFDLISEPVRSLATSRAITSGLPALSARVTLRQEDATGQQAGFLMFAPVYRNGMPVATRASDIVRRPDTRRRASCSHAPRLFSAQKLSSVIGWYTRPAITSPQPDPSSSGSCTAMEMAKWGIP